MLDCETLGARLRAWSMMRCAREVRAHRAIAGNSDANLIRGRKLHKAPFGVPHVVVCQYVYIPHLQARRKEIKVLIFEIWNFGQKLFRVQGLLPLQLARATCAIKNARIVHFCTWAVEIAPYPQPSSFIAYIAATR